MYGFIEPLEATSLGLYEDICRQSWDGIFGENDWRSCNENVRTQMKQLQNIILWHYQYGSKYDTEFWEYAKSLPFKPDEKFKEWLMIQMVMKNMVNGKIGTLIIGGLA